MPTYVYECKSCTAVFEADQSIKDDPLNQCESCGVVGQVKRVIQPVGIAFKGSGFHINDYANSSTPPKASKDSEKSEAGQESKPSETKPAAAETSTPVDSPSPAKTE